MLNSSHICRLLLEDDELPKLPQDAEALPDITDDPDFDIKGDLLNQADDLKHPRGSGPTITYLRIGSKLNGRARRKIGNNTYVLEFRDYRAVRLHGTDVIVAYPNGTVKVNTGGWETRTTLDRINDWLPSGWGIYSLKSTWYWYNRTEDIGWHLAPIMYPFTDGDTISPDGMLNMQRDPVLVKRRKKRT